MFAEIRIIDSIAYLGIVSFSLFALIDNTKILNESSITYYLLSGFAAVSVFLLFLIMFKEVLHAKKSREYKLIWSLVFLVFTILASYVYYFFVFKNNEK